MTKPKPKPKPDQGAREEAYMIASVAVDYHVTQVVDGTKGIHGTIPKAIFAER
jgi:acetamidase/formamidase